MRPGDRCLQSLSECLVPGVRGPGQTHSFPCPGPRRPPRIHFSRHVPNKHKTHVSNQTRIQLTPDWLILGFRSWLQFQLGPSSLFVCTRATFWWQSRLFPVLLPQFSFLSMHHQERFAHPAAFHLSRRGCRVIL